MIVDGGYCDVKYINEKALPGLHQQDIATEVDMMPVGIV